MRITQTTAAMRRVRGETWGRFMGVTVCLRDAEVHDFKRTTYRLFGVAVWRRDHSFVEVPLATFIADCLGTGR